MPGAFFLSRNKEATEVYSLGLTKTVLTSSLTLVWGKMTALEPQCVQNKRRKLPPC